MLTDTHVHLVYLDKLRYPWLDEKTELRRDASYDDYLQTARQVGITRALHMEVDVHEGDMEAESDMVASLMARPDSILAGAIAACRPESAEFPAFVERQRDRSYVKGLRRVLHVVDDEVSRSETFRSNISRLAEIALPFDICVAQRQLPIAIELADACPKVQFVLDHCGVPDIRQGSFDSWARHVASLAERDNVAAKISGVMAYADGHNWALDDLRRYVEHVIECFGWQRIVWGSDSPVCTLGGSISTWVAATRAIVHDASSDERVQLFSTNAARIWNLPLDSNKR